VQYIECCPSKQKVSGLSPNTSGDVRKSIQSKLLLCKIRKILNSREFFYYFQLVKRIIYTAKFKTQCYDWHEIKLVRYRELLHKQEKLLQIGDI